MKALILAAGYATRLYPLTQNTAKPLLNVQGKRIIDSILEKLDCCKEITEIFVVTNNKFFNDFVNWAKIAQLKTGKKIIVINDKTAENGTRLGAIGDIHFVVQQQQIKEDLLVIAGDNLFSFEIKDLLQFYKEKKASIVAVYDTKDKYCIANRLGCVAINQNNKIIDFEEKPSHPKSTLAATACYVFPKEDLHFIEEALKEKHFDRPGDLIKFIAEKRVVYGYQFAGYWFDVGTPEEYALVNNEKTKL